MKEKNPETFSEYLSQQLRTLYDQLPFDATSLIEIDPVAATEIKVSEYMATKDRRRKSEHKLILELKLDGLLARAQTTKAYKDFAMWRFNGAYEVGDLLMSLGDYRLYNILGLDFPDSKSIFTPNAKAIERRGYHALEAIFDLMEPQIGLLNRARYATRLRSWRNEFIGKYQERP